MAASLSDAMFMHVPEAPVKRLLANLAKELENSPDDPHLLYLAGRTRTIAYAMGEDATARAVSARADFAATSVTAPAAVP